MKKIALLLVLLLGAMPVQAGDLNLTEAKFMSWAKNLKVAGHVIDAESLENYDDREFTIDFMSSGAPDHLSIKVQEAGEMRSIKGDPNVGKYAETTVQGRAAIYCTIKSMKNMSMMFVALPKINGELRLLTSPAKSVEQMKHLLAGFDLKEM